MSNRPIIMSKIKQIIRCHCEGHGSKKTSSITGVSRNVIRQYLKRFAILNLTREEVENKTDQELSDLFYPQQNNQTLPDTARFQRLHLRLPEIVKALRRRGMTVEKQWLEYIQEDPVGYGRTQFYNYLVEYRRRSGITMHIEHKAGEKMFVDFCGDKLQIVDTGTGEIKDVEVFVAILGCSQLTYVEAVYSQTKEDFIQCCRNAFEYFGGVPKAVVPDNLKAAVTKSSKYEPILNETFANFAEHYNTVVLPARSYKPKDKALVESAVKIVYQRIYAVLNNIPYPGLDKLNTAIKMALEDHNNAPLKQGDSRRKIFEEEERSTLIPLPTLAYELRKIRECKVMKNGYVGLHEDRHYYSVSYQYIGKRIRLIYNSSSVQIYSQFNLIASHDRNYRRNRYTTQNEHLASQHRFLSEWNPEYFISRAKQISEEVAVFIERLMESKAHPEQGYKACSGVLNLAKRVGSQRIIGACKRAIEFKTYHYYILEDILKKGLDKITPEEENIQNLKTTPVHHNVRGKEYYQQQTFNLKTNNHE